MVCQKKESTYTAMSSAKRYFTPQGGPPNKRKSQQPYFVDKRLTPRVNEVTWLNFEIYNFPYHGRFFVYMKLGPFLRTKCQRMFKNGFFDLLFTAF